MLLLLKPWQEVTNLKLASQTWSQAFDSFLSTASLKAKNVIAGIQYLYEAWTAAEEEQDSEDDDELIHLDKGWCRHPDDDLELSEDAEISEDIFTEEGLTLLQNSLIPLWEEFHGRLAVEHAKEAKIFISDNEHWSLNPECKFIATATGDDLQRLMDWRMHMDSDVNVQNQGSDFALAELEQTYTSGKVTQLDEGDSGGTVSLVSSNTTAESSLPSVDPSELNLDQFHAYDIITWHLDQTLAGLKPPPLWMIIHGEGGMGKSQVIQTITDYFTHKIGRASCRERV